MHRQTLLGLFGVVGIWLTAGLALPLVNVLKMFTPEQLMVFRGFLTAMMAFVGLGFVGVFCRVDKYTYLIALTVPFATLGLFQGIRNWGAGPTIIVITATPLVNLGLSLLLGRKIPAASIIGMTLLLGGVAVACWGEEFHWAGFAWSVFGAIMNGTLYEFFARAKSKPLQKCFWGSVGMGTLGLMMSFNHSWEATSEARIIVMVLSFAFVGGFLYWIANMLAFDNLPTTEASVLAQVEAPAVILGAGLILGEHTTMVQWFGVAIALLGGGYLMGWLSKQPVQNTEEKF